MSKNYYTAHTILLFTFCCLLSGCNSSNKKNANDNSESLALKKVNDDIDSATLRRRPEYYLGKWKHQGEDYPPKQGNLRPAQCLVFYKNHDNISALVIHTTTAAKGANFGIKGQYFDDTTRYDNVFKVNPTLPHPPFDRAEDEMGNVILINEYANNFRRFRCSPDGTSNKLLEDNIRWIAGQPPYRITWEKIGDVDTKKAQDISNAGIANLLIVSASKAYLYNMPDENNKTKSFLITGESVEVLKSDGDYVYTGRTGNGNITHVWVKRADLSKPDQFNSELQSHNDTWRAYSGSKHL